MCLPSSLYLSFDLLPALLGFHGYPVAMVAVELVSEWRYIEGRIVTGLPWLWLSLVCEWCHNHGPSCCGRAWWNAECCLIVTFLFSFCLFPYFVSVRRVWITLFIVTHLSTSYWARGSWCKLLYFVKTHFNIIFLSTPQSSKGFLSFRFLHQNSTCGYTFSSMRIAFFPA